MIRLPFRPPVLPAAEALRADLVAGLTVAAVALPQSMAYAVIAGAPPRYGLYAAILPVIVSSLFGSSRYLVAGPTNAISMLVFATMASVGVGGAAAASLPEEARLPLIFLMAALAGTIQIAMGLARLGGLVNFISHSVVLGFTAGAGLLIAVNQLKNLLGLAIPASPFFLVTAQDALTRLGDAHGPSLALGLGTILFIALARRLAPRLPAPVLAIALSGAAVWAWDLERAGVRLAGEIPRSLPPFTFPPLDLQLANAFFMPALAVAVLGVVEALSIAKSLASLRGEKVDGDREFIAQGLANLAAAHLGGIPGSGSFTRSAVNYAAGARSRLAGVAAGLFTLLTLLLFAPAARYIPVASLAGLLMVVAWSMIDRKGLVLSWRTTPADRLALVVTFAATLVLELEKAVFVGVFLSLILFLRQASHPRLSLVTPQGPRHQLAPWTPGLPACPQAEIHLVEGALFFGAVSALEDKLYDHEETHWGKTLILSLKHVRCIDATGAHALKRFLARLRGHGARLILVEPRPGVEEALRASGLLADLGEGNLARSMDEAIGRLVKAHAKPEVCAACQDRIFFECRAEPSCVCREGGPDGGWRACAPAAAG